MVTSTIGAKAKVWLSDSCCVYKYPVSLPLPGDVIFLLTSILNAILDLFQSTHFLVPLYVSDNLTYKMSSTLLLTLAALQGVKAWGSLGHATVAYIAQNYVTDEVASW